MSLDADDTAGDDTDLDPVSSVEIAEFEAMSRRQPRRPNLGDPSHPEFMEMVSVTPGQASVTSARSNQEPLMPALLRRAKEKVNNHSKAEERGDRSPRKKLPSPTKPTKGKLSPPGGGGGSGSHGRLSPLGGGGGSFGGGGGGGGGGESESQRSSGSSSMDETIVTPLASAELVTPRRSSDTVTSSSEASAPAPPTQALPPPSLQPLPLHQHQQQQQQQLPQAHPPASRQGFEAFMIPPDSSTEVPLLLTPRRTVSAMGAHGEPPATSYTLESTVYDAHTAREAGLPVIGQSASDCSADGGETFAMPRGASREGSVGSSRSSGDFSDHESHKIHQDHKARESLKHSPRRLADLQGKAHAPFAAAQPQPQPQPQLLPGEVAKQGRLITDHLPEAGDSQKKPVGGITSFAEIRRLKAMGSVDNSGYVYMQHGQDQGQGGDGTGTGPPPPPHHPHRLNFKPAFEQQQQQRKADGSRKKATFARLPNEMTWQQSTPRSAALGAPSSCSSSSAAVAGQDSSAASNGESLAGRPATSELSQLRLKLEEKRREIERKKQRQEVQTAKMRQRLGKAAFMRVISKQDDPASGGCSAGHPCLVGAPLHPPARPGLSSAWAGGVGVGADATDGAPSSSSSSSSSNNNPAPSLLTHALLQERLGQVGVPGGEPVRPTSLATRSPASSSSTSASESPSTAGRAGVGAGGGFSREGIQQTIDGVRRRWFHGSDPEGDVLCSKGSEDDDAGGIPVGDLSSDMMQSCPPSVAAAAFGYNSPRPSSSLGQEARASPALVDNPPGRVQGEDVASAHPPQLREWSQSPRATPERRVSSSGSGEQEEYDQSLNKLNRSLTELQGEIKRLTLQQQEQFRSSPHPHSQPHPQGPPPPDPRSVVVPPQHQPPPPHHHHQPQLPPPPPASSRQAHLGGVSAQHPPPLTTNPLSQHLASASLVPSATEASPPPSSSSLASLASSSQAQPPPTTAFTSTTTNNNSNNPPPQEAEISSQEDDSSSGGNGFFVSFGEDTPRRTKPKPKLGKVRDGPPARRVSGEATMDLEGPGRGGGEEESPRVPPLHGGGGGGLAVAAGGGGGGGGGGGDAGSNHSGSRHSLQSGSDDSSSGLGYVLADGSVPLDGVRVPTVGALGFGSLCLCLCACRERERERERMLNPQEWVSTDPSLPRQS